MVLSYTKESDYVRKCKLQALGCAELVGTLRALAESVPENGKRLKTKADGSGFGASRCYVRDGAVRVYAPTKGFDAAEDTIPFVIDYKTAVDRGVVRDRDLLLSLIGKKITLWEKYREQAEKAESRIEEYKAACKTLMEAYDRAANIAREMPDMFVTAPQYAELY